VRLRAEAFLTWHFANAFERGDEIVVDFVRHTDVSALGTMRDVNARGGAAIDMNLGEACRASVDLRRSRFETQRLSDLKCEFPTIDGRGAGGPRRFVWLTVSAGTARGIARLDLERAQATTWYPPLDQHLSEPVFAPRPGGSAETDGWVLVLVYDANTETSHVAVLDAEAPDAGPIGRAHFDHHVAVTLHGAWVAAG
jgi:all-trans-8'-apo-beta-carotenal 15,15'-oxygenase